MSIDASTLTLFQPLAAGDNLLGALYGPGGPSSADPLRALQGAESGRAKDIAQEAADPEVKRDLDAFSAAVANAKTPAGLLANPAALKVLLTANGLGDQAGYAALATKALLSDPAQPTALANQLANTQWKSVAATYQFATKGLAVIQDPKVLATLKGAYAEVLWRQSLDAATPGLSNAISFRDRAAQVTSVDQILGDATLRTVVTTALGIPQEIAFQQLGAQEKAIANRLDLAQLKQPRFVDGLIDRYLLAAQAAAQAAAGAQGATLDSLATQAAGLVV